ncbi:MAG TPA: glycoside hydrolase family 127 protein [Caulifigura sp.]|nr:glycoside hydrolase family 127 protein [Caulifigura sp.]
MLPGIVAVWLLAGCSQFSLAAPPAMRPYAVLHPLGASDVRWTSGFWSERFETCRSGSIPVLNRIMEGTERSQFLHNFVIAAGDAEGKHRGADWNDGDTYKWLETLAATYGQTRDPGLLVTLDRAIAVIAGAQRADGYLHTPVLIKARLDASSSDAAPFHNPQQFEMYNFGHLCTAGCMHFQATGQRTLLDVAIRAADFLDRSFSKPDVALARHAICPSHYMGLIDLYRVTGDRRYLRLVERWLEMRDLVAASGGGDDNQDRLPFREQREAVGHAVRGNYLYAGVTDLYLETGDKSLLPPLEQIWENLTQKKLYVTGGCGALFDGASPEGSSRQAQITRVHQAYGRNYQLPNSTAHNETCAAIGNVLWNWRMLLATGESRFGDVLETSLSNACLAGVSLDGKRYFYTNTLRQLDDMPVELRWSRQRQEYISCFCCPPNLTRLIAEANTYAYTRGDRSLWVNLFGSSEVRTEIAAGQIVGLEQETSYPWDGRVTLRVTEACDAEWTLALRIPAWATEATVSVNAVGTAAPVAGEFFKVHRKWAKGDVVVLELPMKTRVLESNPLVEETRNQVAVQRGPLVYCLESADLPDGVSLQNVSMRRSSEWTPRAGNELLAGVTVLEGTAEVRDAARWEGRLYREVRAGESRSVGVRLVPYFAWGNRGGSEMTVWIPLSTE